MDNFTENSNSKTKNEMLPNGESSMRSKISNFIKCVTIEPLVACYILPSMIMYLATQNFNLDKACRVNQNYSHEVCDKIINQDVANLTEEVLITQKLVAAMQIWKMPLQTILPAILIIFIGSWSDRTGRRKPAMLVPLLGEFTTCIGLIVCVYYFMEWPLEVAAFVEAVPPALCGGFPVLLMASWSYLSDNTSNENRTFRLGVVNIIGVIGMPIGQALSGVLIKYLGYYGVFSIVGSMYIAAFLYTWIRIKDNNVSKTKSNCCISLFNPKYILNTFSVILRPREGYKRMKLNVLVSMNVLVYGPTFGELGVVYLFLRYKFKFTEIEYSIYGTYSSVVHIFGTMFAVFILNRWLKVNDYWLGVLASSSKIAGAFVFAFAPTVTWMYVGSIVECFSGFNPMIIKTITSKIVDRSEIGRLYSIIGILDALTPTIYYPLYNKIYVLTMESFPGAFFFLGALTTLPSIVVYIAFYFLEAGNRTTEPVGDEEAVVDGSSQIQEQDAHKEMYVRMNSIGDGVYAMNGYGVGGAADITNNNHSNLDMNGNIILCDTHH